MNSLQIIILLEWIKWSGAPLEDKKELVAYLQQLIKEEEEE